MSLIFITEDNAVIREGVRKYLEKSGYNVLGFETLKAAREALSVTKPDLLIQDVMLPDGDGFEFVKELHSSHDIPVIFMTALSSEENKVTGFENGADDYITKPFSPKELVLRVQAVLRRTESTSSNAVPLNSGADLTEKKFQADEGVMTFNRYEHKVTVNGGNIALTSAEWRILDLLIKNAMVVLPRAQILKECFDYTELSYERIADTHIKNLRAKLGPYPWIETVRGYGYKFIAHPAKI